jgi:hypothetical protein
MRAAEADFNASDPARSSATGNTNSCLWLSTVSTGLSTSGAWVCTASTRTSPAAPGGNCG